MVWKTSFHVSLGKRLHPRPVALKPIETLLDLLSVRFRVGVAVHSSMSALPPELNDDAASGSCDVTLLVLMMPEAAHREHLAGIGDALGAIEPNRFGWRRRKARGTTTCRLRPHGASSKRQ
jgi:hypothetical protein